MTIFAFSVQCRKDHPNRGLVMHHSAGCVEGINEHEALGRAMAVAKKLYSPEKGFYSHDVVLGGPNPHSPDDDLKSFE